MFYIELKMFYIDLNKNNVWPSGNKKLKFIDSSF